MLKPKSRITRQRSQPRPVLSGQLMVITLGSPGLSGCRMTTTSSFGRPISLSLSLSPFLLFLASFFLLFLRKLLAFFCFSPPTVVSAGRRDIQRKEKKRGGWSLVSIPVPPLGPEYPLYKKKTRREGARSEMRGGGPLGVPSFFLVLVPCFQEVRYLLLLKFCWIYSYILDILTHRHRERSTGLSSKKVPLYVINVRVNKI